MIDIPNDFGTLEKRFADLSVPTTEMAFYNHPAFMVAEAENPSVLELYAAFVRMRTRDAAYDNLNRPGFTGGYFVQNLSYFIKGIQVCIEVLLCFFWCDISDRAVQAFCVVPVHPFQGFPFNLAHGFPRAKEVNDFGFE